MEDLESKVDDDVKSLLETLTSDTAAAAEDAKRLHEAMKVIYLPLPLPLPLPDDNYVFFVFSVELLIFKNCSDVTPHFISFSFT